MDRERSVEKARGFIADAAKEGASLVAFSEGYLPGYPLWCLVNPPYAIHDLFTELYANSLTADGPELSSIRLPARKAGIHVSIGFNEKKPESPGTLWASNMIIAPTGDVLCHHQKLVPTYAEKLVWSNGSPEGLRVSRTMLGGLGMLICGENTNPLARYALLAQGEQVHISAFPPAWPFKGIGADAEYDPRRANEIRAAAHSFEGKVYNIVSCGFCDKRTAELSALSETATEVIARTPKP
jgi:predicted amidohydrolase